MTNQLHSIKVAASKALTKLVVRALASARSEFEARTSRNVGLKPSAIGKEAASIGKRFMKNLHGYFDEISNPVSAHIEAETEKSEDLNQIDNDHLEAKNRKQN